VLETHFGGGKKQGFGLKGVFCVCCDLNAALSAHMPSLKRRTFIAAAVGAAAAGVAGAGAAKAAARAKSSAVVYRARKIITMDSVKPLADTVAVEGGRIVAVGTFGEVKAALGSRDFSVDETFASKVLMPGLIEQHLHPILAALSIKSEVIANDEWVLPDRVVEAATTPEAYRVRLPRPCAAAATSSSRGGIILTGTARCRA
jgi:hypothetical protein